MKKVNTILVIILFVMAGCTGCKQSGVESNDFITVDVTADYPKKELVLQDFLDVEYIPLESSDEFITAGYVQAIGKNILLVRNTNQAGGGNIFFFDRNGKGLRKINRRGQSGEEYINITGLITLDESNGEMFVHCGVSRDVLVYDLSGNFKRSFKYMDRADKSGRFKYIYYDPVYSFDRDHLIVQDFFSGRDFSGTEEGNRDMESRNIFWIISKRDGSVTREIKIPFEKKIFQVVFSASGGVGMVENPGLIPYRDGCILVEPSADTIYRYSADHNMTPFIVRTPSVQSMNPEVFLFPGVITERYCFMQTIKKEYDKTESRGYMPRTDLVYDRQEKKIFKYTVYNDDFTNERPIKNLVDAILKLTVVNNEEIAFMEKIEADELVEAYEKGQLKGRLKEIAAQLNEDSNPVIMLAKYRKQ
ncbi:MAG: 6-bladed beta-propeller [Dysgonamonadaceae bacterium]|jgi:hypothetical protein|nr:6-bladed beta-propeller [Dysgonamonadaceae bacterium]